MVRRLRSFLIVVVSLCAVDALATTVLYQDVPALARQADAIVLGTVTKQQSRWTGDHRRIVTDVVLRISEAWKAPKDAKLPETATLRQPGGVVGDIGQRVDGFASFREGEEVLVFLERRPDGSFVVAGAAQGKYRIERSADGRGIFAVPDQNVGEALVLDPATHEPVTVSPKTWALEDLRIEIARAIAVVPETPSTPPNTPPVLPGKATGAP